MITWLTGRRLRASDPRVRLGAVRNLARYPSARTTRLLLNALLDSDKSVRFAAYDALVASGSGARGELLQALAHPAPQIRSAAIAALGENMDLQAAPELVRRLCDPEETVRAAACEALGKLGDRQWLPQLREALEDRCEHVRRFAAEALGRMPDPKSLGPLITLLRDPDEYVQRAAAHALFSPQWKIMDTESKLTVALAVQDWLLTCKQKWAEFEPALVELQKRAEHTAQQQIESGEDVSDVCLAFMKRDHVYLKFWCIQALGEMGAAQAVLALLEHCTHPDELVADAAHAAVVAIARRGHLSVVESAMTHGSSSIRYAAIEVLGAVGQPSSLPWLKSATQASNPQIRQAAQAAVEKIELLAVPIPVHRAKAALSVPPLKPQPAVVMPQASQPPARATPHIKPSPLAPSVPIAASTIDMEAVAVAVPRSQRFNRDDILAPLPSSGIVPADRTTHTALELDDPAGSTICAVVLNPITSG